VKLISIFLPLVSRAIYTFWDYSRDAYGRDAGFRIDHFLLSSKIKKRLIAAGADRNVRGWEKTVTMPRSGSNWRMTKNSGKSF